MMTPEGVGWETFSSDMGSTTPKRPVEWITPTTRFATGQHLVS